VIEKPPVKSLDATPDGAVRFGKAYEIVLERYKQKPKIGTLHELWRGDIDPGRTAGEDEIDLEAEYLFRQLLDAGELCGQVRDPQNREILNLANDIWLSEPSEFDGDFLIPNDSMSGNGTNIDGKLRPVFFKVEEFKHWIEETFEKVGSEAETLRRKKRPVKLMLAMQTILAIWPNREWKLVGDKEIFRRVDEYLRSRKVDEQENGFSTKVQKTPLISLETVKRAKIALLRRRETSDNLV
jgi:hypothetical protein